MRLLEVLLLPALVAVAMAAYDPTQLTTGCCDCFDLMPSNFPPGTLPQVMPSPFKIKVNSDGYQVDREVIVELMAEGDYTFRSFILVAWVIGSSDKSPVGSLRLLKDDGNQYVTQPACKPSVQDTKAIRSADLLPKKHLRFVWETDRVAGHVEFRATFVMDDNTYWVAEKSAPLMDPRPGFSPLPKPAIPMLIVPIDTSECGNSKGCYREPEGCSEPVCEYLVSWYEQSNRRIRFEISGLTDGSNNRYVAMGLSHDTYMGNDIVFACAHSSLNQGFTDVYLSHNRGKKNVDIGKEDPFAMRGVISDVEGSHHNGRLRCRFSVNRDLNGEFEKLESITNDPYHLLMSRGYATEGRLSRHGLGVNELPIASPVAVRLSDSRINIGDRARYPLVKAHACLMILAWVFFASLGLLMTKYYKTMWPNSRMFEQRYWFVTHFNCMAMVFLLVVIGIILIFVEAGGWSLAPDLPQRAHPILGIIIFVCIVINPVLALLRPSENSRCRPVFNWFHWAFGTIANVLAIPQIFIGMDFGKANVPWWATWILVIWVIFHIIIELTLEVHQCCTYKKNKDRRRKYEQQKRENPKLRIEEPEPAGRRFKRFMLFLHLTVTIIVTIIMIIVLAVC